MKTSGCRRFCVYLLPYDDSAKLLQFAAETPKNISTGQLIEIALTGRTGHNAASTARRVTKRT